MTYTRVSDEKREAITRLLIGNSHLSDRKIARIVGVGMNTVAMMRLKLKIMVQAKRITELERQVMGLQLKIANREAIAQGRKVTGA